MQLESIKQLSTIEYSHMITHGHYSKLFKIFKSNIVCIYNNKYVKLFSKIIIFLRYKIMILSIFLLQRNYLQIYLRVRISYGRHNILFSSNFRKIQECLFPERKIVWYRANRIYLLVRIF